MRVQRLHDDTRRSWVDPDQARPVRVTVWGDTVWDDTAGGSAPGSRPLTVLSHGTGGQALDLAWVAEALAARGHVVVGIDHHGNTSTGPYLPEGFAFVWERPRDVSFVLDWAVEALHVDPARISAVGFSLGGYTCAALAGARIDATVLQAVMDRHVPMPPLPEMPDLLDQLSHRYPGPALAGVLAGAGESVADARVSRIVMLAPSLGALMTDQSLEAVSVPALVMWGDADAEAEPVSNAQRYASLIPGAQGASRGADVEHYWWLADHPSGESLRHAVAPEIVDFLNRS
ncbi:prolyl oligopeptidase family serine peptidase [Demequina sp. B12]|uniref:alpha/beta hydrolase family protein n=1 Tax=Demequina sp. B12 TaxID=2992757 RepID=UPI00237ACE71|nr:alpha/beta fold hydrolase [Demequina sp. B12]MDE0573446.1 prolyl oligopeptidase family serine peptidase [Demequina sp. B12]